MSESSKLRKRQVQRNFARAAEHYERFAALSREVLERLMDRLAIMHLAPERVLDLGSGTGLSARALAERFPRAEVLALDLSLPMLRQQRDDGLVRWQRILARKARRPRIAGDFEHIPLRDGVVDLVASNLALHWSADPPRVFAEARRVLRPGGLYAFSTLGPDTLKELREAGASAGAMASVLAFVDMHDLGDALLRAGFADPVMEMEQLTLTYQDIDSLWQDLRGTGSLSAVPRSGLRTPRWKQGVAQRYESWRRDERLPATFEVIFGHAWKPQAAKQAAADGVSVIRFERRPRGM
jgi:malonyl-CoA O-methyltransferase